MNFHTRCVVFDIDDTLYLERDYVRSGFSAVDEWLSEQKGVTGFCQAALAEFEQGTRRVIFDRALANLGVPADPNLIQQMVNHYRNHKPNIQLLPDAKTALGSLHRQHFRLAVVSDGPVACQGAKAMALGLATWCAPIVLTDSLGIGFSKPHSRGFEIVEKEADVDGAACVYVADNPAKDFVGPKGLRWRTVRVRRPGSLHCDVPSGPDVDIEVTDLLGWPAELENPK